MVVEMKEDNIRKYSLGDVTLWLLFLEEIPESDFDEMYVCCTKERRAAADRIKPDLKRKQCIGAGYLLFHLKKRFGIDEDPTVLSGGKPIFRRNAGVHFSISHSGGYAALAFGNAPLGVDIECVKRADLKVAKRFFREEEYVLLKGLEEAAQADAFCKIWTGKEAVVKAEGAGLSRPFDSFSVLGQTNDAGKVKADRKKIIVYCSENRYDLYRQKFEDREKNFWVSVARLNICTKDDDSHKIL